MVRLYAAACVVGAAVPLFFLGSFLADEGVDVGAFVDQATATDLALMAWSDVVITALVVIVLAWLERGRGLARWWMPVAATVAVGPSLGLPLLLLLRERAAASNDHPPRDLA
jgi:Terpene cyclase DEP1